MPFKRNLLLFLCQVLFFDFACGQGVSLQETSKGFDFLLNGQRVVSYQSSQAPVPDGVNPVFSKSGFIHPLASPSGQILTRIQPQDHYHHYGIWGPWARATVGGKEVDFWNLGDKKGRVEFVKVLSKKVAGGAAELTVVQHHLDLLAPEREQIALVEELRIKVKPADKGRYILEYTSSFSTPLTGGILLDDYRYGGGIGFRATELWGDDNSSILTSEGKDRSTADGSLAKWIMVKGQTSSVAGRSGILFLSHTGNPAHPEPLRVWPLGQYQGKGNVFIEFCPIRYNSWEIQANKIYRLSYRLIVFDGELSVQEAEEYWKAFVK